jgi:Cytochrome b(N-terminal)/b6/petB
MSATPDNTSHNWTVALRKKAVAALPPETLFPDGQPSYMSSWIYVFGVLSIASLVTLLLTGTILALKGPTWWHDTSLGHFFNSMHLWAVELFFFFMVIHLWGKYWMAAWRGGRARVWITGAITFLIAIPCALTGYVSQQNFDAQWISTQAKDAMNAAGVGSFFNLLNFGQMYSWHILLFPLLVVLLVGAHVLLVRHHGIVPPFQLGDERLATAAAAAGMTAAAAGTPAAGAGTTAATTGDGAGTTAAITGDGADTRAAAREAPAAVGGSSQMRPRGEPASAAGPPATAAPDGDQRTTSDSELQ